MGERYDPSVSDRDLQRARGLCRIVVGGAEEGSEIIDVFQRSPLRVIFPQITEAGVKEAVLINTEGHRARQRARMQCDGAG